MTLLLCALVAIAWLSIPEDEPAGDTTDSWSTILSARPRTAPAERLK